MSPENQAAAAAFEVAAEEREVRGLDEQEYARDPRLVRWGYNPGLRGVTLPTTQTGFQQAQVPVGELIPHRTFQTPRENCTIDEYKPREELITVLAEQSERFVMDALGDSGYRTVLFGVTDRALAKVIEKSVLPTLAEIREIFAELGPEGSPVPQQCPAEDEYDYGTPRSHCATCHLQWLKSAECLAYLQTVSEEGMKVRIAQADGPIEVKTIRPALVQLEEVRATFQDGIEAYIKSASRVWSTTIAEIKNEIRQQINDEEHFLRKDLHKLAPDEKELALVRELAAGVGKAPAPAPAAATPSPEFLAYMERMEERQAERDREHREFMMTLVDKVAAVKE